MNLYEIRSDSIVHRIGGSDVDNLRLKTLEENLVPPGISLFACDTPEEAAAQIRKAFPHATRLLEASRTVGSATVESLRQIGFDVIADPTKRFSNHVRLIHPNGIAGFNITHLRRLSETFRDTTWSE